MDRLINIDNGGTLTDICAWDGHEFSFTKTLTTPFDLSQCLFDGLTKVSKEIYGAEDLPTLLHSTAHIRYSTTQGTNALVERKGPRIGIVTDSATLVDELRRTPEQRALFDDLVGTRVAVVDTDAADLEGELVARVNRLTTDGAARIVVAVGNTDDGRERTLRGILLRKFPRHLLGSVPFLYSWDFTTDRTPARRVWSAVINTFLHPTMERFLYNAEHRLRDHRVKNPLLIYRNDGASSRVAKSVALKTYSSGPRGGLEGTRALAEIYGLKHVLMIDVGGTTTDIGTVAGREILTDRRGTIAGIPTSFPMSNVESAGIGGSSVITVTDGAITVGPESVGAAPGPACFGFGGTSATITDVNLLLGVLDPATYLDGDFTLDADRARAVVTATVAEPLGLTLDEALLAMEQAYFTAMGNAVAPRGVRRRRDHHRRVRRRRPDECLRRGTGRGRAQRARPQARRGVLRLRHRVLRHRAELRGRRRGHDRDDPRRGRDRPPGQGRAGHVPGRARPHRLRAVLDADHRGCARRHGRRDAVRARGSASSCCPARPPH